MQKESHRNSAEFIKQIRYEQCKGWIESYVCRKKEKLTKVSKTLNTYLDKEWISKEDLERIFADVKRDSVILREGILYRATKRIEGIKGGNRVE